MSSHHSITLDDLPPGGERLDLAKVSKLTSTFLVLGIAGLAVSLYYMFGGMGEQKQAEFAYSWLFAFFFFFTITNGGVFWVLLHNLTNSGWSVAIKRLYENLAGNVKWMAIFAAPLILFTPFKKALWEWYVIHDTAAKMADGDVLKGLEEGAKANPEWHILIEKFSYLNNTWWLIRAFLYFAFLIGLVYLIRRWSNQQDKDGSFKHTFRIRALCAFPLALYALTVTFSGVDWVMSMDFTWYSTMWGVYIFAGGAWSSMALFIIVLTYLRGHGYFKQTVSMEHYHLMGQLLFAFTVFWAYIGFDQFFLIWYANITEETRFFHLRNCEGWWYVSNVLVWGHFVATFVILLSAWRKKNPVSMSWVGAWVLLMHCVDIYWLIIPERGPSLTKGGELWIPGAWVGDVAAFVGIGGIVAWAFFRRLATVSLIPIRDPRLVESINASNVVPCS